MSQAAAFAPKTLEAPPLFKHQVESVDFYRNNPYVFNQSDPGSGKTRAYLEWFAEHRDSGGGACLVSCPKTIMEAAWLNDAARYTPHLKVSIATADRRREALRPGYDLYVVNHDAMRALLKDPSLIPREVDAFNVDESTAFKNPTSDRSKAAARVLAPYEHRVLMSGTPAPQGVLDLWHQAMLCDRGERLGNNYFKFRMTTCEPEQVGPHQTHVKWVEKPGALEAVADLLSDIVLRYRLEEVIDMPPIQEYFLDFALTPAHMKAYERLRNEQALMTQGGKYISAIHAGALRTKLLQLLSGALYDEERAPQTFATERYNFVMDLVEARSASLVAFNWHHQRDALTEIAKKRNIKYAVIDSSVPKLADRTAIVERFQNGELQVIFAHPASAGHGLTLTRGVATIWCSPTDNSEHFQQFNRRIYRAGLHHRVEIIKVIARNTIEDRAYDNLESKVSNEQAFLNLVTD